MPLLSKAHQRTPACARQRTTLCSRNRIPRPGGKCKYFLQKIRLSAVQFPKSRRQQAECSRQQPQGSRPVRPISHSTRPPRASAVVPPAQQAMRSAAEGPASHAAARYSARPPSRGRTGSRLKRHSDRWAPAATQAWAPPRTSAHSRFTAGPASTRRDLPRIGQAGGGSHQLRPKDADPQLPHPGPQQPQHQQVSQLVERRGGEDHRQQLPAVHQCEPGRQQPEAAGNPNPVTPARHSRWDLGTGCPHGARSADEARWPRRSPPPLRSRPPPSQRRLRRR